MASTDSAPELDDFQGAWGRQFALAAEALAAEHSRESVRVSFVGNGENIAPELVRLRLNHRLVGIAGQRARRMLLQSGLTTENANAILIARMRASRVAVESEWGKPLTHACSSSAHLSGCPSDKSGCITERWVRLDIPCVNVTA